MFIGMCSHFTSFNMKILIYDIDNISALSTISNIYKRYNRFIKEDKR